MIQTIINAISKQLGTSFPGKLVTDERLKQGAVPETFFIRLLTASQQAQQKALNLQTYPFVVQYFPSESRPYADMNTKALKLYEDLQFLTWDANQKPLFGSGMRHEVVDGTLFFFVDYQVRYRDPDTSPDMQSYVVES